MMNIESAMVLFTKNVPAGGLPAIRGSIRGTLSACSSRCRGQTSPVNSKKDAFEKTEKHVVSSKPPLCLSPRGQQDNPTRRSAPRQKPWTVETSRIPRLAASGGRGRLLPENYLRAM